MGIHLYQHNQTAYQESIRLMEEQGRAAVVRPTGTGKSFIGFKLAEEHPQAKVCWLAPSEYIFKTQLENLKKASGEESSFANIVFMTYSRLHAEEALIDTLLPDYIVLDEFHRCGAAEWGKSVKKLLDAYPEAKVLGLSATNIRYLDNQRDMAEELFEGYIASEMTLGEAILKGILQAPTYVTSLYSYQEEYKRWQRRTASMGNKALQTANEALLEKLRRALEQAEGLDHIFAKHMPDKSGKYLVFCADKNHLDEMQEKAGEWFHCVDEAPHIYTAYYNRPETTREFEAFREDESRHLKLLYCIDMLNEGIHVADVDGVILLRPTVSPILYLQQIGRSLSAGGKKKPVIFDIVNNYESLCCIDSLKQEMEDAFTMLPCTETEKAAFWESFQIRDEVKVCRELFQSLEQNLSASWNLYYQAAKAYFEQYKNLKISKSYVTEEGLTLGSWLQTQRKVYAGKASGNLTEERIRLLEDIGMIWNVREYSWEKGYQELCSYCQIFGNADVKARYVSDSGFPLGKWVAYLRTAIQKKGIDQVLTVEKQRQLEQAGMIWSKSEDSWNRYIQAAKAYKEQYGDLKIPAKYVTEDGLLLGSWFHSLKHKLSMEKEKAPACGLTENHRRQLEELGMELEKENQIQWRMKFELAKEYYEQHGNLEIPVAYCVNGVRLGRWISNIRAKRKNPKASGIVLDERRIRELDSIGMDWKLETDRNIH